MLQHFGTTQILNFVALFLANCMVFMGVNSKIMLYSYKWRSFTPKWSNFGLVLGSGGAFLHKSGRPDQSMAHALVLGATRLHFEAPGLLFEAPGFHFEPPNTAVGLQTSARLRHRETPGDTKEAPQGHL